MLEKYPGKERMGGETDPPRFVAEIAPLFRLKKPAKASGQVY